MLKTEYKILLIVLALVAFGIIMVYSSSFFQAEVKINDGYFFFKRQLLWIIISVAALLLAKRVSYQEWLRLSPFMVGAAWLLLILVLIPGIGHSAGGARRWLRFGPVGFQPSEFAKLAIILYMAHFISKDPERVKRFKDGFVPLAFMVGTTVLLILIEPDIGTAVFITLICAVFLVISGIRLTYVVPIGLLVALLALFVVVQCYPHVQNRLAVFLNPQSDTSGKGYQIHQALIGLGSGGITGVGLGLSYQKLFYLPQQHTDFILSIIGEELGFIGSFVVVLLFFGLFWYGRKVAFAVGDTGGTLLALGVTLMVALQALINIAVVTAALPTKGIGLPFISFGGSSLLAFMLAMGILINIARQAEPANISETLPQYARG
ncbi:MAG: putative lipid II flippase FtsW [Planctomycetes bacterium]|nr:putative lipid II flippase FtsW [Planctomycetota bacterium]